MLLRMLMRKLWRCMLVVRKSKVKFEDLMNPGNKKEQPPPANRKTNDKLLKAIEKNVTGKGSKPK